MLRLVVKHPHPEDAADAPAQQRQQKQRLFRDPPRTLLRAALIRAIEHERGQIDGEQIHRQKPLRRQQRAHLLLQLAQLHRGIGGQRGVVVDELDVALEAVAAGQLLHAGQQERGDGLAVDALLIRLGDGLVDGGVDDLVIHGVLLGDGVRDEHAALETQLTLDMKGRRHLGGGVQTVVDAEAGLAGIERGQLLGLIADNGHAVRLQILERQAEVENGLRARADDHDGRVRQLLEVGGDVHRRLGAAVYAADAAGGKDLDAGHGGDHHRRGDGRRAVHALGDEDSQIAAAGLGHARTGLAQIVDLLGGEARLQTALDDGDGGGHGAVVADDLLHVQRRLHVLGIGHAVGDDGTLQRDNGAALVERLLDLRGDVQITIEIHVIVPPC